MRTRHVAAARVVADYDFNNTYQYVIAREDMHLRWLRDAIVDLAAQLDESVPPDSPSPPARARRRSASLIDARSGRRAALHRQVASARSTRCRTRATGPCST